MEDDSPGEAGLDALGPKVVAAFAFLERPEVGKEGAFIGELEEECFEGLADDEAGVALSFGAEFLALVVESPGAPVDILGLEAGDVGLTPSGMPEELEVEAVFFVGGELEDGLVLLAGDAVAVGIFDLWPGALGENGAEDPLEVECSVVDDAELDVGGDSGPRVREDFHEVGGCGGQELPVHEVTDGLALHEFLEACLGIALVGEVDEAGDIAPGALGELRVLRVHVDLRQLAAEDGLCVRLVLGLEEFFGLSLALGA